MSSAQSNTTVAIPYGYTLDPTECVPTIVTRTAGAGTGLAVSNGGCSVQSPTTRPTTPSTPNPTPTSVPTRTTAVPTTADGLAAGLIGFFAAWGGWRVVSDVGRRVVRRRPRTAATVA